MPLWNSYKVLNLLYDMRICWVRGHRGSGKTSLAFYLAEHYLQRGYRLVTNTACVWADDLASVQPDNLGRVKAVVVADEGGAYLANSYQLRELDRDLRKLDIIILIPSYRPPARGAQTFTIQKVANMRSSGLPLIIYKWVIRDATNKDQGVFFVWKPTFGFYSTLSPGDDIEEVVIWLDGCEKNLQSVYGVRRNQLPTMADYQNELIEGMGDLGQEIREGNLISVRKRAK